MENYRERLNQCINNEGHHLSDTIFEKHWLKTALYVLLKIKLFFCIFLGLFLLASQIGEFFLPHPVLTKLHRVSHSKQKAWNDDIQCSAPPWQCASTYGCLHLRTTGAFQLESCLASLLTTLVLLWMTTICLPTWRSGCDHSASTIMRSWWKVSKHNWTHRQQNSLTQAYIHLFPHMTSASIPVVTTLRSSLSIYIFSVCNTIFVLIACFNNSPEVILQTVLVHGDLFSMFYSELTSTVKMMTPVSLPFELFEERRWCKFVLKCHHCSSAPSILFIFSGVWPSFSKTQAGIEGKESGYHHHNSRTTAFCSKHRASNGITITGLAA
jgi:hypothetical protein